MMRGDFSIPADPFLRPNTSTRSRVYRACWSIVYVLLFRPSWRPMHAWRAFLLRLFGAQIGANSHIYPRARIWAPRNLQCEDVVAIADDAEIYNPAPVILGSHCTISQQAYLCTATHDYNDPGFPMTWAPITVGRYAWIAARASIQPGLNIGEGAVLGLGAVATRDLSAWTIYAGLPARSIGKRQRFL
jgi:putative colanic acid biosynthesis acetyltransferase WcaF